MSHLSSVQDGDVHSLLLASGQLMSGEMPDTPTASDSSSSSCCGGSSSDGCHGAHEGSGHGSSSSDGCHGAHEGSGHGSSNSEGCHGAHGGSGHGAHGGSGHGSSNRSVLGANGDLIEHWTSSRSSRGLMGLTPTQVGLLGEFNRFQAEFWQRFHMAGYGAQQSSTMQAQTVAQVSTMQPVSFSFPPQPAPKRGTKAKSKQRAPSAASRKKKGEIKANKDSDEVIGNHDAPRQVQQIVESMTGEDNSQCTVCDKQFPNISALKLHLLVHTGEKPHQCRVCGRRFRQKSHLVGHFRIHTGEKPFVCACGRKFKDKSGLNGHRRVSNCPVPEIEKKRKKRTARSAPEPKPAAMGRKRKAAPVEPPASAVHKQIKRKKLSARAEEPVVCASPVSVNTLQLLHTLCGPNVTPNGTQEQSTRNYDSEATDYDSDNGVISSRNLVSLLR